MKDQQKRKRHERKVSRKRRLTVIFLITISVIICFVYFLITKHPEMEQDIETYVRLQVTRNDISPGFEPAAIYFRHTGMTNDAFCCVGTIFRDTNNGVQIATAEHVFRTDIRTSQTLSVRALRGEMDPPVAYVNRILASGRQLGGTNREERDIVIASLGTKPMVLAPYSGFIESEISQNFWGEVVIGNTKIPRLRSLLSGEYVETLGYTRRGEGTNGAVFVIINRHVRRGESGTGYVDDYGGLWVVHAGPDSKEEAQILEEGRRLTGKKITGVATVSGPLFGRYE